MILDNICILDILYENSKIKDNILMCIKDELFLDNGYFIIYKNEYENKLLNLNKKCIYGHITKINKINYVFIELNDYLTGIRYGNPIIYKILTADKNNIIYNKNSIHEIFKLLAFFTNPIKKIIVNSIILIENTKNIQIINYLILRLIFILNGYNIISIPYTLNIPNDIIKNKLIEYKTQKVHKIIVNNKINIYYQLLILIFTFNDIIDHKFILNLYRDAFNRIIN